MSGPCTTPGSMPLPTFIPSIAALNFCANASYTPSCTRMRLEQTQVWPVLRYLLAIAPCTAASRSASSNTMKGALPPSSMLVFLMVGAHWASSLAPTSVEPVKDSLRTVGLEVSSRPVSPEGPVMMLHTPGGIPARSAKTASARAENGVWLAGRITPVQPAAQPGPALRVIIAAGKFQGVIAANTPIGSFCTRMRRPLAFCGMVSP